MQKTNHRLDFNNRAQLLNKKIFTHSFSLFFLQKKSKTIMVCSAFKNERSKSGISLFIYRTQTFYFVFLYGIAVHQADEA